MTDAVPEDAPRLLALTGEPALPEAAARAGLRLDGGGAISGAVADLTSPAGLDAARALGVPVLFLVPPAGRQLLPDAYTVPGADHLELPADPAVLAAKLAALAGRLRAAEERRLRDAALATTPDFIYVFSLDGKFLYGNPSLNALYAKEAVGRGFRELGYPEWTAAQHEREILHVAATREPLRGEIPFTGTAGARFYDYIFNPVFGPSGKVVAVSGTTRDVTERKRAEERLRFLDSLSEATRDEIDPVRIMATTARLLGRHLGVTRTAYADVEPDADTFTIRDDWTDGVASTAGVYSLALFGSRAVAELCAGRPLVVRDVAAELAPDDGRAMFHAIGIGAIICYPLVKGGKLVAMMAVHSREARDWTEAEVALVGAVVERSWAHVERVRSTLALREADRKKDEFLAILAHELRNPLAPLRSGLEVLRLAEAQLPAPLRPACAAMARQVRHMVRLVDDLLDVSRITRGTLELRLAPLDLASAVRDAAEASAPAMAQHGHRLTLTLPESPITVRADATRVVQMVGNLLTNAAKYTAPGGDVAVRAWAEGPDAYVRVSDTGDGIAPGLLGRVFELFTQGDPARARAHGGLGIGLSLVRSLAELHGGGVTAESAGVGMGSAFTIRLPVDREESGAPGLRR